MRLLLLLLVVFLSATLTAQEQRVALLIGNNNYSTPNQLYNPVNDVKLISKTLQNSGFKVITLTDATKMKTDEALRKFQKELTRESVGLFYFAGHGVEIDGTNFLVPTDAKFDNEDILKITSLDINKVIRIFKESKNSLNIVILDACRDNPVASNTKKGLAPFLSPDGLFVAYSAQAGEKAQDGPKDGYSPFAQSFANNILLGKDIEATFKQVRIDVYNETKAKQRPSTYSEILAPFFFVKANTRGIKRKHTQSNINISGVNFIRHKRFLEPQLVLIKAGKFSKGNDDDFEASPQHEVIIEKDFYVGSYEVTFEEYDMFCKQTGWAEPSDNGWGRGKHPVINVSHTDALAYVKWLSKKSKKHYRLIDENEWEYIAHAGTEYIYGFGDDEAELELYAWYSDNSNNHPHKIGTKKANKYGVYDLHGNVAEITDSSYYRYGSSNYLNKKNSSNMKVLRGGAYHSSYDTLEVYKRREIHKDTHSKSIGFRIVLEK